MEALGQRLSMQPIEVRIPGPRAGAGGRRVQSVQSVAGEATEDKCLVHGPRDSDSTKETETAMLSLSFSSKYFEISLSFPLKTHR